MIFGIGIDIIEVDRIRKQIEKGERFKKRIFTEKEQKYCEPKRNKAQNYAARFAAKEAFFKAIGTGWRGGITFKDVEIVNNERGKPEIFLYGKAKEFVKEKKLKNIQVSLSHIKNFASAIVAVEK
jgi:holo-[acyl-carrier protein] synthase